MYPSWSATFLVTTSVEPWHQYCEKISSALEDKGENLGQIWSSTREYVAFIDVRQPQNHTASDFQPSHIILANASLCFEAILTSSSLKILINSCRTLSNSERVSSTISSIP